jgi:hypothetical protein
VRPRHLESILALLSQLFLYLRGAHILRCLPRRCAATARSDSDEFFDRYTQVGVPADDIADKLVSQAVMELRDRQFGPSMQQLQDWLERDAAKVIRKLSRIDEQASIPAEPILELLGGNYFSIAKQKSGFLGTPADRQALGFALNILRRERPDSVLSGLEFLSSKSSSELALAADLVRKAKRADVDVYDAWLAGGMRLVSAALEAYLLSASTQPLSDVPDVARFLYAFWDLRGRERSHTLLWELLGSDAWQLDDLLATLVPVGQGSDGRRTWDSLGDLEAGNIDEILGLDRVLQALQPSNEMLFWRTTRGGE